MVVHFGESVADNLARLIVPRIDIPCLISRDRWEVPAEHVRRLMAIAGFEHPERIMVETRENR